MAEKTLKEIIDFSRNYGICATHDEWKRVFLKKEMYDTLDVCYNNILKDLEKKGVTSHYVKRNGINVCVRPKLKNILRPFNYFAPKFTKVVIIGESPYPKIGRADGLAFSYKGKVKDSLKNILACLHEQSLIDSVPNTINSLESYAQQGILLLNKYLTSTPEIVKLQNEVYVKSSTSDVHLFWDVFTRQVLQYLIDLKQGEYLSIVGFGKQAEDLINSLDLKGTKTYIWSHPSPMSTINNDVKNEKHFIHCTHFNSINNDLIGFNLEPIEWDPNYKLEVKNDKIYKIAFASDGGCKNNGGLLSTAASAAYFPTIFRKDLNLIKGMYGRQIYGFKYIYDPDSFNLRPDTTDPIEVSNERAEYIGVMLGLCEVLRFAKTTQKKFKVVIVLDNMNVLKAVTQRVWTWSERDFKDVENVDLVRILHSMLLELAMYFDKPGSPQDKLISKDQQEDKEYDPAWWGVIAIHQKSHTTPTGLDAMQKEFWYMNDVVDKETVKLNRVVSL